MKTAVLTVLFLAFVPLAVAAQQPAEVPEFPSVMQPLRPTAEGSGETVASQPLTEQEIVDNAMEATILGFQQGEFQLDLLIQDANGDARQRQVNIRSAHEDGLYRALVRIVAPPELAGQSYLFRENSGDSDDIWVYLPALDDAPRRIAGRQVDESFLGTNLTYGDLQGREFREGEFIRQADEEIGGYPVYVIDAVRQGSPYSSVRLWIRQEGFIPVRLRFFGPAGEVVKTLFTEQVDRTQDRLYCSRISVVDQHQDTTTLVVRGVDFETSISTSEFTRENLIR